MSWVLALPARSFAVVARAALVVPLLVAAMGGSALGWTVGLGMAVLLGGSDAASGPDREQPAGQ